MRTQSLDIARGITVAMMVLVNNPGSWGHIYAPLEHAAWHGCTPTDLVFPFFLFWVGAALSLGKIDYQVPFPWSKVIVRTLKLFALGLFLSLFPKFNFGVVRIMGVLQRIALVYFFASVLIHYFKPKVLWLWAFVLIILHYLLLTKMYVPGIGAANLEAETNFGAWLDRLIITEPHLWKAVKTWDPEGLLGTLSSISNGLFGFLIGQLLFNKAIDFYFRFKSVLLLGLALITLGYGWHLLDYPLNKSLWTGSFALFTSGLASVFIAVIYYWVDFKNYKFPIKTFFLGLGVNAIFVFFASGLIPRMANLIKIDVGNGETENPIGFFYDTFINPYFAEPKVASLSMALLWILFYGSICYFFYRKKIVFKV